MVFEDKYRSPQNILSICHILKNKTWKSDYFSFLFFKRKKRLEDDAHHRSRWEMINLIGHVEGRVLDLSFSILNPLSSLKLNLPNFFSPATFTQYLTYNQLRG